MTRDRLMIGVALFVVLLWTIVTVVSLYRRDYTGLSIITPVALTVAGFLFGFKRGNGKNNASK